MQHYRMEVSSRKTKAGDPFHFLECQAFARIFLFKLAQEDKEAAKSGEEAINCYDAYLASFGKDLGSKLESFNALAHHCMVATWLTTQGWTYPPRYGSIVSREIAALEVVKYNNPLTIRTSALRYLITPSYFGGSFEKALITLEPLVKGGKAG